MKKLFAFLMVLVLVLGLSTTFAAPITLTVFSNAPAGAWTQALETVCKNFEKENPDIKIDFSALGGDYEKVMKVKMASNDLPDVFATHGWAIARYGNYLLDLNKEPWAANVAPGIKPLITDAKGKLYVLPLDQEVSTFSYSVEVFEKYGVKVPANLEELMAACETIKTKSNGTVTPIHLGGGDDWTIGMYYDYMGGSAFLSPKNNDAKAFLTGKTINWRKFDVLSEKFLEMKKKGYLNPDVLTAKYTDTAKALAEGKAGMTFIISFIIGEAKKTNPNFKGGIFPIPAVVKGDAPHFPGGEHSTYGIWKDSKHIAAAKKFLAFSAKPENIKIVAEATQCPAGISGVEADLGELTPFFEQYKNIRVFPIWDRVYLPGGMWDVMCKSGQELLAGSMTPAQVSDKMASEYKRLRAAQK